MTCPQCRFVNARRARFCIACAAPLGPACTACGTALPTAARFCPGCGRSVAGTEIPSRFGSPEGERRHVTVLFADLAASMELMVGRDPEQARRVLDEVVERMMEAVHRY